VLISKKRNILIFAAFVALISVPFTFPKIVMDRLTYTFRGEGPAKTIPTIDGKMMRTLIQLDPSTNERIISMRRVVEGFQQNPLFGFGVTGFSFIDAQYHRILIETGLFGLSAFIFLLWKTGSHVFRLWKRYRGDPLYNILTSGTFCAFIGLLFHAIGTNTFIIVRIMEPFWCLVALCTAIPLIESNEEKEPGAEK